MQTNLADFIRHTPAGREADAILRACVHCGFCTATCPTYQLLGDELDGPRGRIYLMKQLLEGGEVTAKTQLHLDRCLTCRSCETTCPSGVQYHRLVDIGREVVGQRVPRSLWQRMLRFVLREFLSRAWLFTPALRLGQLARTFLPGGLAARVPMRRSPGAWPPARHRRRMLALAGCVQPALAPDINAAAARVLDRLGVSLVEAAGAGCCGALRFHLDEPEAALADARRNIDAWWPYLEGGAEAIVMTASGCGAHVREYAHLLRRDPAYAAKAARVTLLARDVAEIVLAEKEALLSLLGPATGMAEKLAFHSPCSLQHGQGIRGAAEDVLRAAGFDLTCVADSHLCCGSAGTYSILQAEISLKLRGNKLAALRAGAPTQIASANIGCIAHLQAGTGTPVMHWIELLDRRLGGT
jgi:glycolate oxidase iron-sulfur subunit